jgi:hypothetical protein
MISPIRIYPYLAPLILTPLSLWLWWSESHLWHLALAAWLLPILWGYLVPAVGANMLGVWEFDTRWKLGRFRPHHGFVFGSATAMLAWGVHGVAAQTPGDVARYALVLASVLGFWNTLYEIAALRAGVLKVYNPPWAEGRGEEAIALDYAPWIFGGFGAAFGFAFGALEYWTTHYGTPSAAVFALYLPGALGLCIVVPIGGFMLRSRRVHGHFGTRPVATAPTVENSTEHL